LSSWDHPLDVGSWSVVQLRPSTGCGQLVSCPVETIHWMWAVGQLSSWDHPLIQRKQNAERRWTGIIHISMAERRLQFFQKRCSFVMWVNSSFNRDLRVVLERKHVAALSPWYHILNFMQNSRIKTIRLERRTFPSCRSRRSLPYSHQPAIRPYFFNSILLLFS